MRAQYLAAKPFPHVVFDNLIDPGLLDQVVAQMPSMVEKNWVHEDDEHLEKFNLRSAVELRGAGFDLAAMVHSANFLYFLSELTGIQHLLPDPYLQGSGYHVVPRGGHFDIHTDRNVAYATGLTRRLAMIIYLNKEWKHEYGGQLELWNSDASQCEAVIEPEFNKTVIFQVADPNYHGLPNTVACPPGRSRNSFAVYYHTVGMEGQRDLTPHELTLRAEFTQAGEDDFLQVDERHDAANNSSQCEEASPKEIGGKSSRLTWIHCRISPESGNRTKSGRQKLQKNEAHEIG